MFLLVLFVLCDFLMCPIVPLTLPALLSPLYFKSQHPSLFIICH